MDKSGRTEKGEAHKLPLKKKKAKELDYTVKKNDCTL